MVSGRLAALAVFSAETTSVAPAACRDVLIYVVPGTCDDSEVGSYFTNGADRKLGGPGVIDAYYHEPSILTAKCLQHFRLGNISEHRPVSGSFCCPDVICVYIDNDRGDPCVPDSPANFPPRQAISGNDYVTAVRFVNIDAGRLRVQHPIQPRDAGRAESQLRTECRMTYGRKQHGKNDRQQEIVG